jgi:TRAP-type uncharacterized transport system substrate-binding protein
MVKSAIPRYLRSAILGSMVLLFQTPLPSLAEPGPVRRAAADDNFSAAIALKENTREANDIAVSIVTSGIACTCARFAEDIRNVINDMKPNGIRVLPVLGVGGLQNLKDLLFLKGVDMAVVDQDNITLLKERDPRLYANLEQRVHYITKLYTAEFHVLANNKIKTYADLVGKKVNFSLKDSQSDVTADRVFNMLGLVVERSHYDNDEAIKKLLKGEIDALIVLSGGPQAALAKLKMEDGVHFLPLDPESLPGHDLFPILADYMPTVLTHNLYPNLIPEGATVPTIANHALLVAYAWPENSYRYRKLERFINEFFGKMDQFRDDARHPKWADFNPTVEVPGWTRFKPAASWLASHRNSAEARSLGNTPFDMQTAVEQLLANYQSIHGDKPITASEKELMVKRFKEMLDNPTPISPKDKK